MKSLLWIGQRGYDCVGLHQFIPVKNIICCDYGKEFNILKNELDTSIYSVEEIEHKRKNWANSHIDYAINRFADHYDDIFKPDKILALPYRSSRQLEFLSQKYKVQLLSPKYRVASKFDDKINVYKELSQIGVEQPNSKVAVLHDESYRGISNSLGHRFVIKKRYGSAGTNCYFVHNQTDFDQAKSAFTTQEVALISSFVDELSFNIHLLILDDTVLVSSPSIQIVGLLDCTLKPEAYCGNDFAAIKSVDTRTLEKIHETIMILGSWMHHKGFRGIAGIDLLGDETRVFPIDINPRFQGSTTLMTQLELLSNIEPTVLKYLRSSTEIIPGSKDTQKRSSQTVLRGSQLILHSKFINQIELIQSIEPGIYTMHGEELILKRRGVLLSECTTDDDFLITSGVIGSGYSVEPNSPLMKIFFRKSVFEYHRNALSEDAKKIVDSIYARLRIAKTKKLA